MYRSQLYSERLSEWRVFGFRPAKQGRIVAMARHVLFRGACLAKAVLLLLALSQTALSGPAPHAIPSGFWSAGPDPEVSITKKVVDRAKKYAPGDVILYHIVVTNTGDVPLTNLVVTDANADNPNVGSVPILAPGASSPIFPAQHTVTEDDLDNGRVDNIAEVSGKDPDGNVVAAKSTDPDCPDCPTTGVPLYPKDGHGLEVTKTADRSREYTKAGDVITYKIEFTNAGPGVLKDSVSLRDYNADEHGVTFKGDVQEGAGQSWTVNHTVTQEDVDRGYVYNIALGKATAPDGKTVRTRSVDLDPCPDCPVDPGCPDCTVVPIIQKTEISLIKDAVAPEGPYWLGDTIWYNITVTNTGDVTVYDISVTDDNADVQHVGDVAVLAPGDSHIFYDVRHTVTQADVDEEFVLNIAKAEGKTSKGKEVTAESTTTQTPPKDAPLDKCPTCTVVAIWQEEPGMSLTKDLADPEKSYYRPGDRIEYVITVRNTGNVHLKDVTVTDLLADTKIVGELKELPVGEGHSFPAFRTVKQEDIDRGYVLNIALAEGLTDPNGEEVTAESTTSEPLDGDPIDPTCPTCTVLEFSEAEAVDDFFEVTWLADRRVRGSVLDNDKLNKKLLDPSEVILTPLAPDNMGLWMDRRDGTISLDPLVVPGTYEYPYFFCEVQNPENCSQAKAIIVVLPNDKMSVFVPNIFTPNGDGVNDTFEILGLEEIDRADLVIINRWGNEVYHTSDYRNAKPWTGETLNTGAYYYIVTLHKGDRTEIVTGSVLLAR